MGAAEYLGTTITTLERNHGHHHPAYLGSVRGARGRHRTANGSPILAVNQA
jgi:hypothetical protein